MRALMNISTRLPSVWSNGRNGLQAVFRHPISGCVFIMQVSAVSSKPWQIHRKGKHV